MRTPAAARLAALVVVALSAAACETAGERSGTGNCPAGEVCSPKTPQGLRFRGPDFADDWIGDASVKRTAVGGTQTISVIDARSETDLLLPFNASVDSAALTADEYGALVTLRGQASGAAMLRITDRTDGKLFDRVGVEAETIASASVGASHRESLLADDGAPVILVGTRVELVARLYDGAFHRLVDQSLRIDVSGAAAQRITWDTADVTPAQAGAISVALTAGGSPRSSGSIGVVDAIDALVPGWTSFDASNPPLAKQSLIGCVEARSGGAPVVGLEYTMSATGADSTSPFGPNCLAFTRVTAGQVTIHGAAGGKSADLVIDVGAPASARGGVVWPLGDVTMGERAASVD